MDPGRVVVSVVVVSYNTRDLTRACLASVAREAERLPLEIIVVDNDSHDGSAEMVASEFPEITLIASPDNEGFARANNRAFQCVRGEFVLLLNPDAEVRPGAIADAVSFAREHPDAGIVGCRVLLPDGRQQSTLFRYQKLGSVLINTLVPNRLMRGSRMLGAQRYVGIDLDVVQDVEVVAGCFMLVRREVLDTVGGMDPGFFMYGEEAEWCFRVRRAGWRILYDPDPVVVHVGGESAKQAPSRMSVAMARSQLLFLQRTQGRLAAYVANALMLLRDLPRVVVWSLLRMIGAAEGTLAGALRPAAARFPLHLRGLFRLDWSE